MPLPPVLRNLPLPIIGAPLFIISNPKLVIEQCKAGVVGSMPALNARPAAQLDDWLAEITEALAAYDRAIPTRRRRRSRSTRSCTRATTGSSTTWQMCAKYKVPIVITSLGARTDVNDAVHGYGGIVLHDVINNTFAQQGDREGRRRPDRGGGRRRRPCRREEPVRAGAGDPRVVRRPARAVGRDRHRRRGAGGAGDGRRLRLHRLGLHRHRRRRAPSTAYKQMIVDGSSDDIVYINLFTGVHGNYLKPSIRAAGLDPDNLPDSDPSKMNFGGGDGAKPRPGRTSGAAARASARSRRSCRRASWSRAWRASTRRRACATWPSERSVRRCGLPSQRQAAVLQSRA